MTATTEHSLQTSIDYYKTLCDQLQHALDSRIVIEQAKGLLAERYQLNVDDAFQLLRAYCRANNMKLTATARGLVACNGRTDTPGPTPSNDHSLELTNDDAPGAKASNLDGGLLNGASFGLHASLTSTGLSEQRWI